MVSRNKPKKTKENKIKNLRLKKFEKKRNPYLLILFVFLIFGSAIFSLVAMFF